MMGGTMLLFFSLPPVALRRNNGRGSFVSGVRAAYSERMHMEALAQGWRPGAALTGDIEAFVMWRQCGHGDVDNCLAGAKATLDALGCAPARPGKAMTYLGVYDDDAQIRRITVEREQVAKKGEEGVLIRLRWLAT